jgi:hypothetical protein
MAESGQFVSFTSIREQLKREGYGDATHQADCHERKQ